MKASQVRRIVSKLDLDPARLGASLDTGRSSIYRWMECGTDGTNAIVLNLLDGGKVTLKDIEDASR